MKLLFVGDCVIKNSENFIVPQSLNITSYDYRICNFEAPISEGKDIALKKVGPSLSQSRAAAEAVAKAGFNVCLLANNHIMDYGVEALRRTISFFNENQVFHVGAGLCFDEIYKPLVLEKEGEKVAIFNLSEAQFGVAKNEYVQCGYAWIGYYKVFDMIKRYKEEKYFVIMCCHAGLECFSTPLPEWKNIYHRFIDVGVDCIIASHPHIIQAVELYKGKYIYYSLGNFFFDSLNTDEDWMTGMVVSIDTTSNTYCEQYVEIVAGRIDIVTDGEKLKKLQALNEIIYNDGYIQKLVDNIAADTWGRYYKSYYENTISLKAAIIKRVKKMFGIISEHEVLNYEWLLHNIQIETHRYLVERYLYNYNTKENNL